MRKWEEKYKEIQSGKLDTRISELQGKFNNKSITKEELKELENSKRIKENIPKITNIIEFKTKLEKQLEEIKNEQVRRENIVEFEKEAKKLENELEKLKLEEVSIRNQMKSSNLSDKEKADLKVKFSEIIAKENENQEKYSTNQLKIGAASKTVGSLEGLKNEQLMGIINSSRTVGKLGGLSKEELKGMSTNISSKISKCNMICSNLIKGYSWDSIDLKLDQWQDRKLTSKKDVVDKIRSTSKVEKENSKVEAKDNDRKNFQHEGELGQEKEHEEKLPANVSEFDKKHPRLAKIKNFFKKTFAKLSNPYNEGKNEEKSEEEKTKTEKDDFKEYIKVVAEKGMKEADKERLAAKKREMQEKIAAQNESEKSDEEER